MIKDIPLLTQKIYSSLQKFTKVAIVGMSGGADSTLVATLCREALGKENVYSAHMPVSMIDNQHFNSLSTKTAEKLELNIIHIPIEASVSSSLLV